MKKKIALITGTTSGIGEGCARRFAQGGYDLIITARRGELLHKLQTELEAQGTRVLALAFDVRDREATRQAIETLPADWQAIDVLVNNAGLARGLEPEYEGSFDDWDEMIDTNIKGLLNLTRFVVPGMWNATAATSSTSVPWQETRPTAEATCTAPRRVR